MASDRTQQQSPDELHEAQGRSLERSQPPSDVPGYELREFLGAGAYGEVWAGVDRNTGRKVAVKFYLHRGGVDWSLLSREVEKLVFLSADRYVVQLLDVGWDAEPPYYVMEYVEAGSLDELLQKEGNLPLNEAVELFREISVGLVHSHGKGVLHCDLKPANVLLDQDRRPRLADFGQSRLSHEQTPALGTLFYMAPEQADLDAVPDARWDVYALGAILYCLLTGQPPHRNETAVEHIDTARNLSERLTRYRQLIAESPLPADHRQVPGIDRALSEILQRSLAIDPRERYATVQEILAALESRERARARRPLMVMGIIGPILLLLVMALFGWRGYSRAIRASEQAVAHRVALGNRFAARAVAETAAGEIEQYFRAVEQVATDPSFQDLVDSVQSSPNLRKLLEPIRDPRESIPMSSERQAFIDQPERQPLQSKVDRLLRDSKLPEAASWFVCDNRGTQIAAAFANPQATVTIGRNYGWRTYFHGGPADLKEVREVDGAQVTIYQVPDETDLKETQLSAPFQSTATKRWKVAISTPVRRGEEVLGVVAMTVNLGVFLDFPFGSSDRQFAVLVDGRMGDHTGMILQHPLFDQLLEKKTHLLKQFTEARFHVRLDDLKEEGGSNTYQDPLAQDPAGADYNKEWVAAKMPVHLIRRQDGHAESVDTGLVVVVQEDYQAALDPVHGLGRRLLREGLGALVLVLCIVFTLWYFVFIKSGTAGRAAPRRLALSREPTPLHDRDTLAANSRTRQ